MTTEQHEQHDSPLGFTVLGIINLAGGAGQVAKRLGLSIQAVNSWDRRIPKAHARDVAIMAGLPLEVVHPAMVRGGHADALAYVQDKLPKAE